MKKVKDMFSLQDKVALITGGTRGLGEKIAELFIDAGARAVITGRDEKTGHGAAERLSETGGEVSYIRQDVALEADWQRVIEHTLNTFGGLDIVVNNAGLHELDPLVEVSLEAFQRIQQVNVDGVFLGMKEAMRVMKPGGEAGLGGVIVNVSSIAGLVGFPAHGAYGASKGAVRALSKVAAIECAQLGYGIRVNSVFPGVIPTDMAPDMWDAIVNLGMAGNEEEARAAVTALHPLGLGEPDDVAAACLYLASDAAKWVTGAELVVDGGFTVS